MEPRSLADESFNCDAIFGFWQDRGKSGAGGESSLSALR